MNKKIDDKNEEIETLKRRMEDINSIEKVVQSLHENSSSIKSLYERINSDRCDYLNTQELTLNAREALIKEIENGAIAQRDKMEKEAKSLHVK